MNPNLPHEIYKSSILICIGIWNALTFHGNTDLIKIVVIVLTGIAVCAECIELIRKIQSAEKNIKITIIRIVFFILFASYLILLK